ncbi:MAG TPA: hypothetical protein VHD32_07555 [Candidatus Didemnitutus sp.]|nr:hypothetical protein [Candidatus Didemnitutus sp.]
MSDPGEIPVVLFAYARPDHLTRLLAVLRTEGVPRLIAFADGAKGRADEDPVNRVREILRAVTWAPVELIERPQNLGLGRSVLTGINEVAARHEAFIVFEDDLVCSPGTYAWMAGALRYYRDERRVFSVTGWTHPRVQPSRTGPSAYFDARAESWSWGAYARSWQGMDQTALEKVAALRRSGIAVDTCGADLPAMAEVEARDNLWAVRWLYHHLMHGGLCLRPPMTIVQHAGYDKAATNAKAEDAWPGAVLAERAPAPAAWPLVREAMECRALWQAAAPAPPGRIRRIFNRILAARFRG